MNKEYEIIISELIGKVKAEIKTIEDDERYHYPTADVFINAPLALVQLEMETRVRTLERILKEIDELSRDVGK